MGVSHIPTRPPCGLDRPRRNRYFYGKLLDTSHFELETDYHNTKRRLLNRLVTGWGVVCGLDVRMTDSAADAVVIRPGLALDPWGREIVVDRESRPIAIPPDLLGTPPPPDEEAAARCAYACRDPEEGERCFHLVLCYHECADEPAPVLAGECAEREPCQPGVITERWKAEFRPGAAKGFREDACIPDFITYGQLDYDELVRWVSQDCPACPEDPCLPLANVRVAAPPAEQAKQKEQADEAPLIAGLVIEDVDITIRPIVYGNDVLFELVWSLLHDKPAARRRK